MRHLDLVLDEGQYRGSGTFVAQWVPRCDDGSCEPSSTAATSTADWKPKGELRLVPMQGVDGTMLPSVAFCAVAKHGPQYYEVAGFHSAVFVEADTRACNGSVPSLQDSVPGTSLWAAATPGMGYRLYCDCRHAHKLLQPCEVRLEDLCWDGVLSTGRTMAHDAGVWEYGVGWSQLDPVDFTQAALRVSPQLRRRTISAHSDDDTVAGTGRLGYHWQNSFSTTPGILSA